MKTVMVAIHGCDNSTYLSMEVTQTELEFLKRLGTGINGNSKSRCEPIITIDGDDFDYRKKTEEVTE